MSTLYVVGTPIGNMGDISERMCETLRSVNFIVAEDTRVTGIMLSRLGISTPLKSCHKYSEESKSDDILSQVNSGGSIALVTDAGMPCISDPGYILVSRAYERGFEVKVVPGPSAVVSAMALCGFDAESFSFFGFLPRKSSEIVEVVSSLGDTINAVFYESPKRILDTLEAIKTVYPDNMIAVLNDMTKIHERVYRGTVREVLDEMRANDKSDLGEYVIVLHTEKKARVDERYNEVSLESIIVDTMSREGLTLRDAQKVLQDRGYKRNALYEAVLKLKEIFNQK